MTKLVFSIVCLYAVVLAVSSTPDLERFYIDRAMPYTTINVNQHYGGADLENRRGDTAIIIWDFETGWQGWYHTNGQPFPAAWDVITSGYYPTWTPPDAGDSTMWIDSDAATSAVWVQDTAISPAVVPGFTWLKYGLGYNWIASGEWLEVGVKYFDGSVWSVEPLMIYNSGDFGPARDSVDVSAYNAYDSIQVYFYYDDDNIWAWYAAFDNVELYAALQHDVGCLDVISPPEGSVLPGDFPVIGHIHNFGSMDETFDVTARVFDTTDSIWAQIFSQTVTLTDFPAGGDTLINFGEVTFEDRKFFYTEIYTFLSGDENPSNDTASTYSQTAFAMGDVVFEIPFQPPQYVRFFGIEFDGSYFYCTGATDMTRMQSKVFVVDTFGNLVTEINTPAHVTGWGWRDLCWDDVYAGPDRIDTLYASADGNVDKFSIDRAGDSLIYWGYFDGPENPNRALAYDSDHDWFFTANFSSPCYKFNKDTVNIQYVPNTWAWYGAAYDNDGISIGDGPWVWWHSYSDPVMIHQMDPVTMDFTGVILFPFVYVPAPGIAGGLCFYSGFRDMDMLFVMSQGNPSGISGIFVRYDVGIEEKTIVTPIMKHDYITATIFSGPLQLPEGKKCKVFDITGRVVEPNKITRGVYFIEIDGVVTQKVVKVR